MRITCDGAMMWLCTNWQIDWTAISTVVATVAALGALLGYWLRRNARVRLLARLILADLVFLHVHLQRKMALIGADAEEELQGYFDAMVAIDDKQRARVVHLPSDLPGLKVLRQHASELDVLPVNFSDALAKVLLEFSLLEAAASDLDSVGEGDQPTAMGKMESFRKGYVSLQAAISEAQDIGSRILKSRWRGALARWPL